jgi:hypothetical protein
MEGEGGLVWCMGRKDDSHGIQSYSDTLLLHRKSEIKLPPSNADHTATSVRGCVEGKSQRLRKAILHFPFEFCFTPFRC